MGPTLSLLTASLLIAQTPNMTTPGKTCPCQKNASAGHVHAVPAETTANKGFFARSTETASAEDRPTFLSKLQGLFGKKKDAEPEVITYQPSMEPSKTPRLAQRLPAGEPTSAPATPGKTLTPANYQAPMQTLAIPVSNTTPANNAVTTQVIPPSRPNRISPELANKVGHEADYSWITGQIRIENGLHVVHYATPEVVDRFNGSLVLSTDRDLREYRDGDYVSVRGQVVQTSAGRTTLYRVSGIDLLKRGQ